MGGGEDENLKNYLAWPKSYDYVLSQWLISLSQDYTCPDAPQMPFPGINVSVLGSLNPMWLLTHLVGELSLTFQNLAHFSEIERKHISHVMRKNFLLYVSNKGAG